ncbi:sigma-70 family RNA polymerase sigma factor [Candidatus Chloroploca sp. M-50]|uniref:Sigma-70 family RNA polymerase sigma factor n=1 Tax=Candidatus Chloroploca mongolica TaxID=2528176 RepID=A0ABS4D524_9CHLR|nr:sigma-70 family RNA polymerase sigma factor [Candidatus Chloroploca mongolica]MBP1464535.1 sigma-70 family RNA polymerase sigma factor [Candidatus Chloroploca mongolica]
MVRKESRDHGVIVTGTSEQRTEQAQISDEVLIVKVATGDNQALEVLYHRYSRVVYGLAVRIVKNAEQAEDIVQETFWRVWRRASTFRHGSSQFLPWLFGIARNLCIDELRRRQARPATGGDDDQILLSIPDLQPAVDDVTWDAERRRLIIHALGELPSDQRQVIEMAYFGGLSQREIADQLEHPLGTVKTRIRLALQKLKGALQDQGISLDDR